jgi:small subunit ribosomal protein S4
MTKRTQAKFKVSRRLGINTWGKEKDPVNTKNYPNGQHASSGRKMLSIYGKQLLAKQKLKAHYGNISEKQFANIYAEARRKKGDSVNNLISLLESRLDILVYRMNFVPSVFAARQLVNHGHVLVNGKKVNIASFKAKIGDEISIKTSSQSVPTIIESAKKIERNIPEYLSVDLEKFSGKLVRNPEFNEVPYPFKAEPNLIIEFYSK